MKSTLKAALIASVATCATSAATAEGVGGINKIGLAVPNLQADFFNQIKLGVESYATKLGIEVIVVDAKNDTATQVSQVQDLITQGIDAFIYIPAGAAAAAVPTRLARAEGIPVINVDREPDGAPGDTVIYGENVVSAYQVCNHIIELAGGEGKMVTIHGQKGTTPEVQRFEGCKMAIDENPGVELVAQQWSQQWSPDEGFNIAQNMLQANPDITIIFGQADGLAMGAAKAVEVAGLADQVIIGGYDGDGAALESLVACDTPFIVTATQSTQAMGVLAVNSAIAVANGASVPARQIPNAVLTTCDDAAAFVEKHP
ncbi:monosaccharide ABC transporter substrate-binding protein (CUT2 family) [Pacificibacter maritimus]|uniref:Monosaccharide ABC transporter substrate-binding protein (CUT2 family) n=1 Tax=Pacificibacter maritimus TaxID=762213 RepID=A0A3N4TWT1_9RHOB|nr:substrate-binding domain-containing protein [Pacificibacter maritimus]RPE62912.1 monosaccharide ABC transporter substrate-binding protein (CUT2 family) [Pacificibacter maritimus]